MVLPRHSRSISQRAEAFKSFTTSSELVFAGLRGSATFNLCISMMLKVLKRALVSKKGAFKSSVHGPKVSIRAYLSSPDIVVVDLMVE